MQHDPRRLEAHYGALRRALEARGHDARYRHEILAGTHQDALIVRVPIDANVAHHFNIERREAGWFVRVPPIYKQLVFVLDRADVCETIVALIARLRSVPAESAIDAAWLAEHRARFITHAAFEALDRAERLRGLEAYGWQELRDNAEVRALLAGFGAVLAPRRTNPALPPPSHAWKTGRFARESPARREELEADLTLRMLAALRATTPRGERILVLDWVSTSFEFDPHAPIVDAYRESWGRGFIDDEALVWAPRDGRFGVITDWRGQRLRAHGAELLAALEADPPELLPWPKEGRRKKS